MQITKRKNEFVEILKDLKFIDKDENILIDPLWYPCVIQVKKFFDEKKQIIFKEIRRRYKGMRVNEYRAATLLVDDLYKYYVINYHSQSWVVMDYYS